MPQEPSVKMAIPVQGKLQVVKDKVQHAPTTAMDL